MCCCKVTEIFESELDYLSLVETLGQKLGAGLRVQACGYRLVVQARGDRHDVRACGDGHVGTGMWGQACGTCMKILSGTAVL